jgi:hypothetical protein
MILIWPLVLAAIVAVAVWLTITLLRARKLAAPAGPVCAACGYSTVGLTTTTCPECGHDLRAVGILAPGVRRPGPGLLSAFFLYSALLAFVALVVTPAIFSLLPKRLTYERTVRLVTPNSGAYKEIAIRTKGHTWRAGRVPLPVEIDLIPNPATPQSNPTSLTLRPDGSYHFTPAVPNPTSQPATFGPPAVLEWLKSAGLDTASQALREEATRIAAEARLASRSARRAAAGQRYGGYSSRTSGSDSGGQFTANVSSEQADRRPAPWLLALFTLLWLAAWLYGLRYLTHRDRKPTP